MGLFDFLTSTKRPDAGVPAVSAEELKARLLASNRPGAPYEIALSSEGCDLIAKWRIVDAQWYEIFAKAGLAKGFEIRLLMDEQAKELRAKDFEFSVEWRAGVPSLSFSASASSGQTQSIEFGKAYGFTEKLATGEIYNYKFATSELKGPIQAIATAAGWTYKGVAFGKL